MKRRSPNSALIAEEIYDNFLFQTCVGFRFAWSFCARGLCRSANRKNKNDGEQDSARGCASHSKTSAHSYSPAKSARGVSGEDIPIIYSASRVRQPRQAER